MISAVVLTKNEEKNIVDCLESLRFCDEIIVIDDNSEDRTKDIAEKHGAKVFTRSLNNNFSEQRNYGFRFAQGEWVLFVDADERISKDLVVEIVQIVSNSDNESNGFYIKRKDILFGKKLKYGEAGNISLLRLGKKDSGIWKGKVHETWNIKGKTEKLHNSIEHYPHETITEFLKEINFYTTLRAQELYEQGKKSNFFSVIFYPKAKFLRGFIVQQGFRDGIEGLIFAILMSFHSFLVRGKLWLLWNKK